MRAVRYFSNFVKSLSSPTDEEIIELKDRLLKSSWNLTDDVISTYPAKQLYITLESLLNKSAPPFMENLNTNNENFDAKNNVNNLFKIGDNVPIGYSLAYCNPLSNESELSIDGYDNYHAPTVNGQEFFKRRMWVSGSFSYNKSNPLKFGDTVNFTETVKRVKLLLKNNTIFADYNRSFDNSAGNSLIESRRLCYLTNDFKSFEKENTIIQEMPDKSIILRPSLITSFRMSALTFNSHQIHYNPNYAKNVEKYTDVVLEAPLLVALALQFWSKNNPNRQISTFKYKITSPCFINNSITINYKSYGNYTKLWISCGTASVFFDSTIQL